LRVHLRIEVDELGGDIAVQRWHYGVIAVEGHDEPAGRRNTRDPLDEILDPRMSAVFAALHREGPRDPVNGSHLSTDGSGYYTVAGNRPGDYQALGKLVDISNYV